MDEVDLIIKTPTMSHSDYWTMIDYEVISDFIGMRHFFKLMY